jgi:hypothetical protein
MEAGPQGRIFSTKEVPSTKRYKYVLFWINHDSSLVYATFHETKHAKELVQSIQNIRADNGMNATQLFHESCGGKRRQNFTFCAVGAHWLNGIAEYFIGTITEWARTILLNARSKWPDVIQEDMWPFALRHSINFHNASLRKNQQDAP